MTDQKMPHSDLLELRRRAEDSIGHDPRKDESLNLVHELTVNQLELEMQNAELRQARDELETALEDYTDLYDFSPVGYVTLDRAGIVTTANLTGASILGVERTLLLGRPFERFVPAHSRRIFSAFIEKVLGSQIRESCETALLKAGHPELFVQIEAVAASSGGECRMALIDITEHKRVAEALREQQQASEALRQAKEAAESTDRVKSLFLATMSHELRNPLTVILAVLQLALKEELSPVLREYQEMAQRSASSLLRILNDLLDMARIEAGKLCIEEEPFSLPLSVSEVAETFRSEAQSKGLDFSLTVAAGTPVLVVGDQARLQQVLSNLVGNAVKFTDQGRVEVRVAAAEESSGGKREIIFTVTDTGIGVPDDKKGLLFLAFSQVDQSFTRRYGGTGLGLSICRELVELMGGTISCSSAEGTGSCFSFSIPLREAGEGLSPDPPVPLSAERPSASPGGRVPRILLADDDPGNRKAFGALFKMSNYQADFAEDGLQAIDMWEQGDYDLILMDIQMPRLNGFDATRSIRCKELERGGHIPIVALTAHAFKEDVERCLAAGMDSYISKPIDIDRFLQVIGAILNQNERR